MEDNERAQKFGFTQAERMQWFNVRYDDIAHGVLAPGARRIYLGDKVDRQCRYCEKTYPAVTFRRVAHAFPEQIGNKTLIDYLECDTCNEHFSTMVEDDFAKWTMPLRTIGRVQGKRGGPTHKTTDEKMRVEATAPQNLHVETIRDDPRYTVDEDNHTITFTMLRQPYVPMGVFKCLVKTAIAVLPPEEIPRCSHLKRWILEPVHTYESYAYKPLNVIQQTIPGPLPHDRISYCLLRRRPGSDAVPYMLFVLQFSNYIFQITLPMHVEDESLLSGKPFDMGLFPHIWGNPVYEKQYGLSRYRIDDLSGTTKLTDSVAKITVSYERAIDMSPKGDSPPMAAADSSP